MSTAVEFHLSARRIRAGTRGGALAVSGYITGRASIDGHRVNNPHRGDEIAFTGLVLPPSSAIRSGVELWRAADVAERKKDGEYRRNGGHLPILATHTDVALPWGITEAQTHSVIDRICGYLVEKHRIGVEYAVHKRDGKIDHIHLLWSTRTVGSEGVGAKARGLNAIAQRQKGNKTPSAMEEIREIASTAIRDSCGVEWDHRSFKRRGLDIIAEPKLDRKKLREQRRRLEKSGQNGPTKIEIDLNLFRDQKSKTCKSVIIPDSGIRKLKHKSIAQAAMEMDMEWNNEITKIETARRDSLKEVLQTSLYRDDEWTRKQLYHSIGFKIEEWSPNSRTTRQWVARIDPPAFDPNDIGPEYPVCGSITEKRAIETALYADKHKNFELRSYALVLLAMLTKKTKKRIQWQLKCYAACLGRGAGFIMFVDKPYTSVRECIREMDKLPHARIKPTEADDGMLIERARGRDNRGTGVGD